MRTARLLAAALALAVPLPALAQDAGFFRRLGLSPAEADLAGETAASLFTRSGVGVGDTAAWESPDSPAQGRVEVTAVTEGGRCVAFRHLVQAREGDPERPLDLRRCRDAEGNWILTP